MKFAKEMLEKK